MQTLSVQEVVNKLDFPVSLRQAQYTDKDGRVRDGVGKQVVREDTNTALTFVSDTYGLIKHSDALSPVLQAIDGLEFRMRKLVQDHAGAKVMVNAISEKRWQIAEKDDVALSLLFSNSYDRTSALRIVVGAYRFVCTNGAVVPHPAFAGLNVNVRVIHSKNQTRKLDVVALGNSVAALYAAMDKQADQWREWNRTVVSKEALESLKENVLEPVVGVRALEDVTQKIFTGRGNDGRLTLWNVFNAITEHYTDKGYSSKTPVTGTLRGLGKQALAVEGLHTWVKENQDVLVRA